MLKESFVTYCDSAKAGLLGVKEETLREHTAVSAECASQMAEGARSISGADWAVSVTGYAGPDGGAETHPVGTVFVGVAGADGTQTHEFHLPRPRPHPCRVQRAESAAAEDEIKIRIFCLRGRAVFCASPLHGGVSAQHLTRLSDGFP